VAGRATDPDGVRSYIEIGAGGQVSHGTLNHGHSHNSKSSSGSSSGKE